MEDNRKFATFFADAPKGKKIGAVLSWIATAILLVALFVPGYRVEFQTKESEKGEYTTASGPKAELLKESWKAMNSDKRIPSFPLEKRVDLNI